MSRQKKSIQQRPVGPTYPISFETFRSFGSYDQHSYTSEKPSCGNGNVRFRKYKITVEIVDEPVEVLAERIQWLWDNTTNYHHSDPLRRAAASIGYQLQNSMGNKSKMSYE